MQVIFFSYRIIIAIEHKWRKRKKSKALDIDGCVWMENFKGGLKESKVNEWVRWKEEENIGNEKWERKASEQCREYQES